MIECVKEFWTKYTKKHDDDMVCICDYVIETFN